jgi:gliding-associated putative ABC transporter substrate-binding component GldG
MAHERQFYDYLVSKVVIRTVLLLLVLVFGLLAVDNWVLRWDLTEDQRYSISPATVKIISSLPDPLTIRAYFSGRIPERIVPMQRQVFDVLAEYEARSSGRIKVERYDPLESAEAKNQAENYGVHEIEINYQEGTGWSAQRVFGSVVLIYGDRAPQVVNIAERYGQGYEGLSVLESELSGKIYDLSHERTKVGLTGYMEREGGGNPMMGMQQPRPEFNQIRSRLGASYDIEDVDLDRAEPDPKKMPLLVIIRPKEMSDVAIFRLDQYLMKGGRVLCFMTEGTIDQQPYDPNHYFTYQPFKTGMEGWLEHNGLRVPNEFVLQYSEANEIPVERTVRTSLGSVPVTMMVKNWFWPTFGLEDSLDKDNPAVQNLKSVDLFWVHPIDILESKLEGKQATALVRSYEQESWRWKDLHRIDMRQINPKADTPARSEITSSPVAVALDGSFKSYFTDRPVPPSLVAKASEGKGPGEGGEGEEKKPEAADPGGKKDEVKEGEKKPDAPAGPEVVKATAVPTQLVVVGNAIFLSDMVLGSGGPDRAEVTASLALNLVNWLAGSPELIALRAKRYTNRALKDKSTLADIESWKKQLDKGEIDADTFRSRLDEAHEREKARETHARWLNVLLPVFFVWFCGAVIWVLRAASRGGAPRIPVAEPPESLSQGGTDS